MKLMSTSKLREYYPSEYTWFTGDTHFGHTNIIKYANRPFSTVEEMDEVLIENWNKKVGIHDVVYHLGDFSMKDPGLYIKRLHGKIILILGNHDYKRIKPLRRYINDIREMSTIQVGGEDITLCHYAMRVWNKSHFNTWHLYGHSHGKLPPVGKSLDVGVDVMNYAPVNLETLKDIMEERPDNFNLVRNRYVTNDKE